MSTLSLWYIGATFTPSITAFHFHYAATPFGKLHSQRKESKELVSVVSAENATSAQEHRKNRIVVLKVTSTKLLTFWAVDAIKWSLEHQSESCRMKRSDDKW